jgi:hypothetical protein
LPAQRIDSKLRLTLREGSVYYFTERSLRSVDSHYFVVVNSNPIAQELLLLGVVTSKVAEVKQRRRNLPETVVQISPRDFDVFKKLSIVDCNDLKQVRLAEFNARFVRNDIRYFNKDLPAPLRNALRGAIHASPLVPDEIKTLVAES